MKNKIMLSFLAILFTTLVASFMSKSDENLFKEFQKNFKTAKFPLKVQVVVDKFNENNKISTKYSEFFAGEMRDRKYSRMPMVVNNEYLEMVIQNEDIVAVIVGVSKERFRNKISNSNGTYTKTLVVYDKKGNILDSKQIAYKYSNAYISTEILSDLTFTVQKFGNKNEANTEKWLLEKTENFMITASGKIVNTNQKEVKEQEKPQKLQKHKI